jgi:serine phosphatase RsbU (regulator of sigma subunit)
MSTTLQVQLGSVLEPLADLLAGPIELIGAGGETVCSFGAAPQGAVVAEREVVRRRLRVGDVEEIVCPVDGLGEAGRRLAEIALDAVVDAVRCQEDLNSFNEQSLLLMEQQVAIVDLLREVAGEADVDTIVEKVLREVRTAGGFRSAVYLRLTEGVLSPVQRVLKDDRGVDVAEPLDGLDPISVAGDPEIQRVLSTVTLFTEENAQRHGVPSALLPFLDRTGVVAPVEYASGEVSETLGLLITSGVDSVSYFAENRQLTSAETKVVETFATILAAVFGSRERARLEGELANAQEIQQLILPRAPAEVTGYDLAGACKPSGFVGGDYYDFLPMADGRTLVVVADVSGHNLASGMIMVEARAMLRALVRDAHDPVALFDRFAATIHADLSAMERFITAVAIAVAPDSNRVELVNAGHNDTLVWRAATGTIERVVSEDTVLGFMPGARHERSTIDLSVGDVVVAFTDGITEATDDDDEMFGEERLEAALRSVADRPAREILDGLLHAVAKFQNSADDRFDDDVTAVVLAYRGQS